MSVRFSWFRITDTKTGESAKVDGTQFLRTMLQQKQMALRILRSKIFWRKHRSNKIVATYKLPDDNPYPMDLHDYRKDEDSS